MKHVGTVTDRSSGKEGENWRMPALAKWAVLKSAIYTSDGQPHLHWVRRIYSDEVPMATNLDILYLKVRGS